MGGPTSTRSSALLRHAADVTTDWLTAALADAGVLAHGSRVVSFETEAIGTGQMADTTRFSLRYDEDGSGPASVVGKFASADDLSRGHRPGVARLRDRGPLLPRGRSPRHGARPAGLRGGGRARDRLVHAPARGHRGWSPRRPDRSVHPRRRGRGPRGDGGTARAVLGGGGAGRTGMAATAPRPSPTPC